MASLISSLFTPPLLVFLSGFLLRAILLIYGIYQDSVSALKYTDIDYYVFTDAARAVSRHSSPYDRATYRYTPLLAWILLPTTWGDLWFHFGKALFALSDLIAGWLILTLLKKRGMDEKHALKYASVWLLNPMVANISTRGSSEGLLCVLVMALLGAFETRQIALSGFFLGLSVHFKLYPFIYGVSMLWVLESSPTSSPTSLFQNVIRFFNQRRLLLLTTSLLTFTILNVLMYNIYGPPFLQHTFLHHFTRIDHRHNFSPYNTLLYLSSAHSTNSPGGSTPFSFESVAFIPQLLLSTILIPLALSKRDLPATMLAQTLTFVTFNKVCTSQYFLWYLIFLPLYLPRSSLTTRPTLGATALVLWILGQAAWLQQGYQLEFLGRSTFVPGLFAAGLAFFIINCWILGIIVSDVLGGVQPNRDVKASISSKKSITTTSPAPATASSSSSSSSGPAIENASSSPRTPLNSRPPTTRGRRSSKVDISSINSVHLGPRNHTLRSN